MRTLYLTEYSVYFVNTPEWGDQFDNLPPHGPSCICASAGSLTFSLQQHRDRLLYIRQVKDIGEGSQIESLPMTAVRQVTK